MQNRSLWLTQQKKTAAAAISTGCDAIHVALESTRQKVPMAVGMGCAAVRSGLNVTAAAHVPVILTPLANLVVNISTGDAAQRIAQGTVGKAIVATESYAAKAKTAVQNCANNVIESDRCYGDESSCVSRTTRTVTSLIPQKTIK